MAEERVHATACMPVLSTLLWLLLLGRSSLGLPAPGIPRPSEPIGRRNRSILLALAFALAFALTRYLSCVRVREVGIGTACGRSVSLETKLAFVCSIIWARLFATVPRATTPTEVLALELLTSAIRVAIIC